MRPVESRPQPDEYAPYYAGYVARVPAGDLIAILNEGAEQTAALLAGLAEERAGFRYGPGKWSIREVIGHIADAERVFAYRMLRIGRGDITPLAGFDENEYVAAAHFDARPLPDLLDELRAVRRATVTLLRGLDDDAWQRRGTANGLEVTVRALATICAGHEMHHREILRTRYLAEVSSTH